MEFFRQPRSVMGRKAHQRENVPVRNENADDIPEISTRRLRRKSRTLSVQSSWRRSAWNSSVETLNLIESSGGASSNSRADRPRGNSTTRSTSDGPHADRVEMGRKLPRSINLSRAMTVRSSRVQDHWRLLVNLQVVYPISSLKSLRRSRRGGSKAKTERSRRPFRPGEAPIVRM